MLCGLTTCMNAFTPVLFPVCLTTCLDTGVIFVGTRYTSGNLSWALTKLLFLFVFDDAPPNVMNCELTERVNTRLPDTARSVGSLVSNCRIMPPANVRFSVVTRGTRGTDDCGFATSVARNMWRPWTENLLVLTYDCIAFLCSSVSCHLMCRRCFRSFCSSFCGAHGWLDDGLRTTPPVYRQGLACVAEEFRPDDSRPIRGDTR